jgi:hypothetical protein
MRRVKQGLGDLFWNEINLLLIKFQPGQGDGDGWWAFEEAYEESLHRVREHIIRAIRRDPRRLHGERRINSAVQAAREREAETGCNVHTIRRSLTKLKDTLHSIIEAQGRDPERAESLQRGAKVTRHVAQVLRLLSTEVMMGCFGTVNHKVTWEQLNSSEEHRARVIEWLDAMINTQVMEEIEGLKQRARR